MSRSISRTYKFILFVLRRLVNIFFYRIEVTGLSNIPKRGGGIVISWHPNALIDPGLILTHFPRRVIFGARSGLFRWPIFGWLMKNIGTVPIYRRSDARTGGSATDRRAANTQSLDALAEAIANGSFSALFPEGVTHDAPHLLELKTGAARLYYRACELTPPDKPRPVIIPVGLHYDAKRLFRSSAMVAFHPPLELDDDLAQPIGEPNGDSDTLPDTEDAAREQARKLTDEFDRVLRDAVHATDSWRLNHLFHRARKLVRAERAYRAGAKLKPPDMRERVLGFARIWAGYNVRVKDHPKEVEQLLARAEEYDENVLALAMKDHELDEKPHLRSPWLTVWLVLQGIFVFVFLPPIAVLGFLVNFPIGVAVLALSKLVTKETKQQASVKVLAGAVLFPLTWLSLALLVAWGQVELHERYPGIPEAPYTAAFVTLLFVIIGGAVVIRYRRIVLSTLRMWRVRLTRARRAEAVRRLRDERSMLYEGIMSLSTDLELPGEVTPEGRIVRGFTSRL